MDFYRRPNRSAALRVVVPGACLLLGLVALLTSASGWVLVIGSWIIHPWMAASALLLAALGFGWLGSWSRERNHPKTRPRPSVPALLATAAVASLTSGRW